MSSEDRLRILLVDDSPTVRAVMHRILRKTRDLEVIGEADDGASGIRLACELRPDLILMDIVMPGVDGFEATSEIMRRAPTAIMVFSTEVDVVGHRVFEALRLGACDIMAKPGSPQAWTELADTLPEKIRLVAEGYRAKHGNAASEIACSQPAELPKPIRSAPRHHKRSGSSKEPTPQEDDWAAALRPIRYLAVGASTGGPEALRDLLRGFGKHPPMAVLVVQHIAPEFEAGLVDWLRADSALDIALARQGETPRPGAVRLAPQGFHLRLEVGGWLRLDEDTPPLKGHRPAADILLHSCARAVGWQSAGVLLSGMGKDGVAGLEAIRAAGGLTLVQDQASSVVFGMPQAALIAGAAELALPPERLARLLLRSSDKEGAR